MKEVDVSDGRVSHVLSIQKVENNKSSDSLRALRRNAEDNKEILDKIDGMEIERKGQGKLLEKLESQNTYVYSFS
ncbi:hypothetical protein ACFQIC_08780 [Halobacillus seohaensis]|uniref:Uncharacterized protein n=2 Tax=Halobacillus seohaensis TaxID=447421 RepID=A0ABW2EN47_9BACI